MGSALISEQRLVQYELCEAQEERVLLIDQEIFGWSTISRGSLREHSLRFDRAEFPVRLDQEWAFAGALHLDHRLFLASSASLLNKALELCGPQQAALYTRRFDLPGYLASISLPGYPQWAQKMSPEAYLQQVWAGSLSEPGLEVHLHFGARIIAVEAGEPTPRALIAWHDPYR